MLDYSLVAAIRSSIPDALPLNQYHVQRIHCYTVTKNNILQDMHELIRYLEIVDKSANNPDAHACSRWATVEARQLTEDACL